VAKIYLGGVEDGVQLVYVCPLYETQPVRLKIVNRGAFDLTSAFNSALVYVCPLYETQPVRLKIINRGAFDLTSAFNSAQIS
jgi:hypothetical protein